MRHAILGVGGVGGLVGAVLAHAGDPVTVILRPGTADDYPKELSLQSPFGNFSAPVDRAEEVLGAYDVLWITVKATQLDSALQQVRDASRIGAIVPLLNGVDHMTLLRERFGKDRVVAATIRVESERVSPGKIAHRSPFARLDVAEAGRERLASSVEKLRSFGFDCFYEENEASLLWRKLVFLGPVALVTSASEMGTGEVVKDPKWRPRFIASVEEACEVATAEGAKVDMGVVLKFVDGLPPGMRSSMQKDVEAGNTPELDAIAGAIVRAGEKHGIDAPVTRDLMQEVEAKLRARSTKAKS